MDMQQSPIMDISNLDAYLITTTDLHTIGTTSTQNLNINGNLTFNPGSMIYINGIMVDPLNLSYPPDLTNTNRDLIINKLEKENDLLRSEMSVLKGRLEYLEKFVQL